jgi:hypothetical protein
MKGAGVMVQTKEPILVPFSKFELEVRKGIAWPDGPKVQIRAVSPGDEDGLREMFSRLSRESINKRFHLPMPRVPDWALAYLIDVDHHDKESLVALVGDEIVGQAMYARQEASEAEVAIVVEDRWQSRGSGSFYSVVSPRKPDVGRSRFSPARYSAKTAARSGSSPLSCQRRGSR